MTVLPSAPYAARARLLYASEVLCASKYVDGAARPQYNVQQAGHQARGRSANSGQHLEDMVSRAPAGSLYCLTGYRVRTAIRAVIGRPLIPLNSPIMPARKLHYPSGYGTFALNQSWQRSAAEGESWNTSGTFSQHLLLV